MPAASNAGGEATIARQYAALAPDRAEVQQQLGLAAAAIVLADAVRPLRRVSWLTPLAPHAHLNLGIALVALQRLAEAGAAFRRTLVLAPDDPDALHGFGVVEVENGARDRAVSHLRRAIDLQPDRVETLVRLANALVRMRRSKEAATLERRALSLAPSRAPALFDLGLALFQLDQHSASLASSRHALVVEPESIQAEINISASLFILGRTAEALARLGRAAYRADAGPEPFRNLLAALTYSSDVGEEARWAAARAFEARHAATPDRRPFAATRDPERRLTVGYLSSDLYEHAIMRSLGPLLSAHDRSGFRIIGYAAGTHEDATTDRLRRMTDGWRSVAGLSDGGIAARVREDGVDILVIVGGRFDQNRPLVASHRAAPVQISLFDGGTSGLAEMDYLIADRILVPPSSRRAERFTERVLRLPSVYLYAPPDRTMPMGEPPCLAKGHVAFACFNNPMKIDDLTLSLWGRVLSGTPGSTLTLKYMGRYADRDLQRRVLDRIGIDPGRVAFLAGSSSLADHLALYADVDIALDATPFTGSTTTWEALTMGVPVVTLLGENLVGRLSASLLEPIGLHELVARDPDDYVRIACDLARDPARLAVLRHGLRDRLARSPLCDGARRARQFERIYRAVWRRWCQAAPNVDTVTICPQDGDTERHHDRIEDPQSRS